MKTILAFSICLLITVLPAGALEIPSQAADGPEHPPVHAGGSRPAWAETFGYISLGCAAAGVLLLVDDREGNNDLGIVLLLPGLAWLMLFAR